MEYTRWDIDVYLDFSEHLQLFEGFPSRSASGNYTARLMYTYQKPSFLQLSIFYENKFYLEERLAYLQEHDVNILTLIKLKRVKYPWEHPDLIDFKKSKLIEMRDNPSGWEHGKRVVELVMDNADIYQNSSHVHHGFFHLTENAIISIGESLSYSYSLHWDDWNHKLIDSDKNKETEFGPFIFNLKLKHHYGNSDKFNLNLMRVPYLQIEAQNENITDLEIIEYADLLCLLMSLYFNKKIDYFEGHARVVNREDFRTHSFFKYSAWTEDNDVDYPLKSFYTNFFAFIEDLDYVKAVTCRKLLDRIIPSIIQSKYVDISFTYMLLYNSIELLRNFCKENNIPGKEKLVIKEDFSFTISKTKTKKLIESKILELENIVVNEDKAEFKHLAKQKVTFIQKTSLEKQFNSIFEYTNIDIGKYNTDIPTLISIRNKLYHGNIVETELLLKYNPILREMFYDLIISLLKY